ncbi:hypothetical protein [Desulfoferula mesophila]|uniref:YcgL domain-containing protein n=1 Tax=Desulfoferula mesophila TaxID=3058419 RepID=A0AAU9EMD2_9BACT|nr:hypothetical protein FAK_02310 [Desulfoferula mesophilus]
MENGTGGDNELYDVHVCQQDPNLFLILPSGSNPQQALPHHALILIRETDLVASQVGSAEVVHQLGLDQDKLAEEILTHGYYIYRRPKKS